MNQGEQGAGAPLEWGVVANVSRETFHGPGGADVQQGLRHYRPGARVWVLPPRYPTEDDQVEVVGLHRGGRSRHVGFVVFRRHLENFRVKGVFSPAVVRVRDKMNWNWRRVWCCPALAQPWADRWNALAAGLPATDLPDGLAHDRLPWPARMVWPEVTPCPHGAEPDAAPH
ncbi:hypothetical protein ACFVHB_08500 [Kitasatospora sp. NPDC127111]|uniref:hypothetical protein n=1 Tax=Kitasatospora sp. NPDC127111 TaxID=3345363 RepID=UPI003636D6CB